MDALFYFFAALTLAAAVLVVASRNPVNSAMAMITALVGVAALFFLLEAPFLGVLQVLVYAGAVMVLFLFVIMLLDVKREAAQPFSWRRTVRGVGAFVVFSGGLLWLVNAPGHLPEPEGTAPVSLSQTPEGAKQSTYVSGAKTYGELLFSKYMLPTQAAGLLLLSAMIGVVTISRRRKE
jgi:NADH-quinone oxidoreductase subunit J